MRGYFWILAVTALCFSIFDATAQVTKGLHFYMPFNEGKGSGADLIQTAVPISTKACLTNWRYTIAR